MVRRFNAKSVIADGAICGFTEYEFPEYDNVEVNWFVQERKYALAVSNFLPDIDTLGEQDQEKARQYIIESFSAEEIKALTEFLSEKYLVELLHEEFVPSLANALSYTSKTVREANPFVSPSGENTGYRIYKDSFPLSDKPPYGLKFQVFGAFNLRDGMSRRKVQKH
jgi:hypothetical protein